eukprot:135430-Pelagomonas_calceolata.AAC.1
MRKWDDEDARPLGRVTLFQTQRGKLNITDTRLFVGASWIPPVIGCMTVKGHMYMMRSESYMSMIPAQIISSYNI